LQLILWSRCRIRAAWMPSQVEATLIRTRDLSMPTDLYSCLCQLRISTYWKLTYLDDVESLVDGGLGIEGEVGINLS
jgi:hypothetical protein